MVTTLFVVGCRHDVVLCAHATGCVHCEVWWGVSAQSEVRSQKRRVSLMKKGHTISGPVFLFNHRSHSPTHIPRCYGSTHLDNAPYLTTRNSQKAAVISSRIFSWQQGEQHQGATSDRFDCFAPCQAAHLLLVLRTSSRAQRSGSPICATALHDNLHCNHFPAIRAPWTRDEVTPESAQVPPRLGPLDQMGAALLGCLGVPLRLEDPQNGRRGSRH